MRALIVDKATEDGRARGQYAEKLDEWLGQDLPEIDGQGRASRTPSGALEANEHAMAVFG